LIVCQTSTGLPAPDQLLSQLGERIALRSATLTDFQVRSEPLHLLGTQQSLQIGDQVFHTLVAVHSSIRLRCLHLAGQNQMLVY
jgi:hypothetical protein